MGSGNQVDETKEELFNLLLVFFVLLLWKCYLSHNCFVFIITASKNQVLASSYVLDLDVSEKSNADASGHYNATELRGTLRSTGGQNDMSLSWGRIVTATSKLFIFFFHNKIPSSHLHTRKEMKVVPNRLPPTMPLWHIDYSELETTEK